MLRATTRKFHDKDFYTHFWFLYAVIGLILILGTTSRYVFTYKNDSYPDRELIKGLHRFLPTRIILIDTYMLALSGIAQLTFVCLFHGFFMNDSRPPP